MLAAGIPCGLSRLFAYDATEELQEVLTGQYVTRHPLYMY